MALRQLRSSLPRDVGLDRASLVHSDRGWITATLCITACQTRTSTGYRECRMLLHELVAKRHDANITQPSFIRISIGYWCVAESTTRLPSSVIKPSNCNNLRILLVYCRHTDSRVFGGHLRHTYTVNTVFIDKHTHAAHPPFGTVFFHLYAYTADTFTSFRSQLKTYMFARHL